MNYFKNKFLRKYILWYFVIFILVFVSNARAGDTEFASLFTQVASKNEVAVTGTIPDRYQNVIINFSPLKTESEEYTRIRIDLLDQSITAKRTKFLLGPQESFTWIGKPENVNGSVIMSVCGNTLFGLIELREEAYKIEPVRGTNTHRIFKLDPDGSAPIDYGGVIPPEGELREKMGVLPGVSKGTDDGTFFDVLVLYTKGFAETYPGDELYAQISYLIGVANTCYSNSEVSLSARVVDLQEVDYTDDGMLADALNDLTNGKGVFSDVPALRNQSGADLVTLLRVFTDTNDVCGLAWQMTSLSSSFERYAYSVVQVGRISFGGGFKFCTDQTLAHEMGHNMGCAHEDGSGAVFNYSKGYVFPPYMSVMAISGWTRVSHFSNPDVSYLGLVTGAENADNARSITKVKLTVSRFRDSKCLGSMTATPDKLSLNREETSEITVTVTGEYDYPVEGREVTAKVNAEGKKRISVSPPSGITDSNGQATFTITAGKKKGNAKVKFKADCLKESVKVKVE
ncbi:MAG: M12 family metallo-peptidase [Candidatus Brocadia sp.]